MQAKTEYDYEHIFIDNNSTDKTVSILKQIAADDKNVKIIVNLRNFGHIRSPYYGLLQSTGDATILIVADLQDPPELINDFIAQWEQGHKIVVGVKNESKESFLMFAIRKTFYNLINRLSDTKLIKNYTGFGLYDRQVIEILKTIEDPYPYFRGLICDIGFEIIKIPFVQPQRFRGITKNNFYTLYDIAMLGITNHSKVPLRLATMVGFVASLFSLLVALVYFVYKLLYWESFTLGSAPLIIGVFLFSAVQLMFIGIIGEYVGSIHTQVLKRPLVIEKERINFNP
jgi:glycosyltransferase involved in cell wall biosynthesis